jgi:hypothetical protein
MEKKKGRLKEFLATAVVIFLSVLLFIARFVISAIPSEDYPWFTPIVILLFIIISIGYAISAIITYRKNHPKEKGTKKDKKASPTLRELYSREIEPIQKAEKPLLNKFLIWSLSISLFVLIWIGIFSLIGFKINKEYYTYNQDECIQENWIGRNNEGIDDCTYWARYNDMIKGRNLEYEWDTYKGIVSNCPEKCLNKSNFNDEWDYYLECEVSPRIVCNYDDYIDLIHNENKDYLQSKRRDSFLLQCAEQYCKRPSLITIE